MAVTTINFQEPVLPKEPKNLTEDAHVASSASLPAIAAANEQSSSPFSIARRCSLQECAAPLPGICAICHSSSSLDPAAAARQQLQEVGSPKRATDKNTQDVDLIVRTVMRYPNEETLQALHKLRQILRSKTKDLSDDYLNWLLKGSSADARGAFRDARSLRAFLNAAPMTLSSSSRLMTGLSTLVHAIAYRAVQSDVAIKPPRFRGIRTLHERDFDNWCLGINEKVRESPVGDHSMRYPDSRTCMIDSSDPLGQDDFMGDNRGYLSDVSDDEDKVPICFTSVSKKFKTKRSDGQYTWVGAAHAGGIAIASSISASGFLALQVLESLRLNPQEIELLAGTLIIPVYHRADYHSICETAAAIHHSQNTAPASRNTVLTPKQAYATGLELMAACVATEWLPAVRTLSQDILSKTTDVGYTA